jgi:hypothetical protein
VTDDIRADQTAPLDLLVVGGLTIDVMDGTEIVGGAARHSTEAALAAGIRVALQTVAGPEALVGAYVERLAHQCPVARQVAATSIVFEHHGQHDARRLRLRSGTARIADPASGLPAAAAVLFAPVASEVAPEALTARAAPLRAAGMQGWLRASDPDGWVTRRRLSDVDPVDAERLRGLGLLLASVDELRGDSGEEAGDAFAAVLVAGRGAGQPLEQATANAAAATARFLATRPDPTASRSPDTMAP